jgi:hypothetical protein
MYHLRRLKLDSWEAHMARRSLVALAVALVMLGVVGVSLMGAQQPAQPVNDKPLTEKWAPT